MKIDTHVRTRRRVVKQAVRDAAAKGLREGAKKILSEAKSQVPEATGELKRSGKVSTSTKKLMAAVSFGTRGESSGKYAVAVHEVMDVSHPSGNAKYLENPANRNRGAILDALAQTIGRKLR